jgi:hypothetical protein
MLADPDFAILAPTAVAAPASASPSASASSSAAPSSAPPTIVKGEQFTQPSSNSEAGVKAVAISSLVVFWIAVAFLLIRRRRLRAVDAPYAHRHSLRSLEPKHARR